MDVGIVGLPGSGKTSLFGALTGIGVPDYADKAQVGVASIPDPRLGVIAQHVPTRKIVHASLRLVDIPGVQSGSGDGRKLSQMLEQVRQVDGICLVVRCFDDGSGRLDPAGDITTMDMELALADLVVAEGAKDKAARNARSGDAEAKARVVLLDRVTALLEAEKPVRGDTWNEAERRMLRSYGFVTAKPCLYVANVAEDDVTGAGDAARAVHAHAASVGSRAVTVCAKLEAELAELDDADRAEMLGGLGLAEAAIGPLARAAHAVVGLTTFYTAGDKEVRAWTTRAGATAPEAAGAIHSDIERGFIRAETYSVVDLEALGSEKALRENGRLRSEGKGYVMQDGDVVNFLFNV
jgi:hypothetical protein